MDQGEAGVGVAPLDGEGHVGDWLIGAREGIVDLEAELLEDDPSYEGVTIRMEPIRCDPYQLVSRPDPLGPDPLFLFDDPDDEPCEIILAWRVEVGHLCGLAPEECAAILPASESDPGDDLLCDPSLEFSHPYIVEEEEGPSTLDEDIIDRVVDEVVADGIVFTRPDRDLEFGPDTICTSDEGGPVESLGEPEEPPERAWLGEDPLDEGRSYEFPDPVLGCGCGRSIYTGIPVAQSSTHSSSIRCIWSGASRPRRWRPLRSTICTARARARRALRTPSSSTRTASSGFRLGLPEWYQEFTAPAVVSRYSQIRCGARASAARSTISGKSSSSLMRPNSASVVR